MQTIWGAISGDLGRVREKTQSVGHSGVGADWSRSFQMQCARFDLPIMSEDISYHPYVVDLSVRKYQLTIDSVSSSSGIAIGL
jgi:hypothetical protein